jgi:hypothetical protein
MYAILFLIGRVFSGLGYWLLPKVGLSDMPEVISVSFSILALQQLFLHLSPFASYEAEQTDLCRVANHQKGA